MANGWRLLIISSIGLLIIPSMIFTADNSDLSDLDQYKIAWKGPLTINENFGEENVINISTKNRDRYKCIVPDNADQLNFDFSAKNSSSTELSESPIQLLESLFKSNSCSYKIDTFWIYEICHGKFIRQYHQEVNKLAQPVRITQEYSLGQIDSKQIQAHDEAYKKEAAELERTGRSRPKILVNGHYRPYVILNMTDGTKCDLTKRSRVTKAIYVCNEETKHELYSFKEISTCEYEAIIFSHLLCRHKDFKVDTNTQHEIKCYSIDGAPDRLLNSIDPDEEEMDAKVRHRIAYFKGKTLIIDADLILS